MAVYGEFKTAKDQRIVPLDVKVAADVEVRQLVKLASGSISAATALSDATHIVALSDETIGGSYVDTGAKNYKPSYKVKASTTNKKVGLYPLFDKDDVIVKSV